MKISVLIIAHNEEKYIAKCILSILNQTQKPDEVVVVVHNSTDKTSEIAKTYPVKVLTLDSGIGAVYARIEGIKNVKGDIILSIDGDSTAESNWIEVMVKTLEMNNNILVGSWIKIRGTIVETLDNIWNKYFCVSKNKRAAKWIWGASFAFWGKDKDYVLKVFEKSIGMANSLRLSKVRIAEDYWLALFMNKIGNLEITNKTSVTANSKESSMIKEILRNRQNRRNGRLIRRFIEENNL